MNELPLSLQSKLKEFKKKRKLNNRQMAVLFGVDSRLIMALISNYEWSTRIYGRYPREDLEKVAAKFKLPFELFWEAIFWEWYNNPSFLEKCFQIYLEHKEKKKKKEKFKIVGS